MCAIAGMISLPCDEQTQDKMLRTMHRRGPDGNGVFSDQDCTLLHSRLAIIDPEGGAQPMRCVYGGELYVIVYNGELYNTKELRGELMALGHCFLTCSDTEVLLHAYMQWGSACLEKLNGIFAFAVWECRKRRLFLARDRIGVKPLFYSLYKDGLLFASEIKTILAYPGMRAYLDDEGAAQLMLLGPGRIPGSGVLHGIREILPGWFAVFEGGKFRQERYWELKDGEHCDSFDQTVERVRYLVTDAIERQMVSDVPIGTFLSGGLDSSIISSVCARRMQANDQRLNTFSVDYANNDKFFVPNKFQPNSDGYYIDLMRQYTNSRHHETVLSSEDLVMAMEDSTRARDLPGMADVDFSLLAFCAEIRKEVKVALSGECADEIFGGYPWFRDPEVRALNGFPWAQNTLQRKSMLAGDITQRIRAEEFVQDQYLDTIRGADILPGTEPLERRMKEMTVLNQRWFMQTLLDRKDRMSMYNGLEVRVPFCDHRIAEYLYTVPWAYKDYKGREKGLLRKAMEGLLPQEVLYRKKSPYPKTWDPNYYTLVSNQLRLVLADDHAPVLQIVRKEALEDLLTAEYAWPWYGQLMNVPQTIAYMLQINIWMKEYHVERI